MLQIFTPNVQLFHDGGRYHTETSPDLPVMKELKKFQNLF